MSESKPEIESNVPKNQELRGDLNSVERETGDIQGAVYSPVITVTKEETTLTKEDMKIQKVLVSEDVSDISITKTIIRGGEIKDDSDSKVFVSVTKEEAAFTSGGGKDDKDDVITNPKQTRIPKLNFKQAVDRIKKEELTSHERAVHEPILGIKVRSSIPRLKEAKQNAQKTQQNGEGKKEDSKKLNDEFDKIYDEIKDNTTDVSISTPESLRDAEIVDSIFEEIIHAYDENVETLKQETTTEKVKSKIPLLKRKSEQDILAPSHRRGSLKKSNSIDDSKTSVQTKSISAKDVESMKVKSSKISGSYTFNKSESVTNNKIESFESSSVVKTIRSQKSVETEHSAISSRERTAVKSNEMPACKIPVKSHSKDKVETKLNSTTLNKLPVRTSISEKISNQKVDVELSKSSLQKTDVKVENDINIPTKEISSDQQKSTVNTNVLKNNEEKIESQQIIETKQEIELSATAESGISSKTSTTNVNNINSSRLSETKEVIQNVNTERSEKSFSVIRSDSENLSQSKDLLTSNVSIINKDSDKQVKVQESINKTKVTEISSTNVQVESTTIKVIETVNINTLEYSNNSSDLKSEITSNNKYLTENQIVEENKSKNINNANSGNNKNEIVINNQELNEKSKKEEKDGNEFVQNNQNKFTLDKKESAEHNSVQRIQSVETVSNSTINISKESNDFSIIESKEQTKEKLTVNSKIEFDNTKQQENIEIHNNNNTNVIQKEIAEENSIKEKYDTKNNEVNKSNDSDNVKRDPKTDNVVNESGKSVIPSQIKNIEDLDEEDIIILKGKVSRIISRLDSREVKIEKTEDDIPRNVSVVSKVAIFEKNEPENHKVDTNDLQTQENDKPVIVDEILKPDQNIHNIERKIFNDSKKEDGSYDYYSVFNKVHSSVLRRLKSIETKTNINFNEEVNEEAMKMDKMELKQMKIDEKNEEDDKLNKSDSVIDEANDEKLKGKSLNNYSRTKSLAELHFSEKYNNNENVFDIKFKKFNEERRAKSLAELDLGDVVKGRVRQMVMRMNSIEKESKERRVFERSRSRGTVLSRAAVFEKKVIVSVKAEENVIKTEKNSIVPTISEEELQKRIEELNLAKTKYGKWENMPTIELRDGSTMPVIAVGTALLEPKLIKHIVSAAIDLGYRAIDTAYIYGNEKEIGEAIRSKIEDGTVKREDLFIISKLWSTFHRRDLVETACRNSLKEMGLEYFDLYMIHNPMSFREGPNPIPKIANVLQYSQHDYLEAWYGMEEVAAKGLAKRIGFSNFNSAQVERIMDKAKIKPVINQVECHPYLTQRNLDEFCSLRNIKLSCYSVLGSKGTPVELKSGNVSVIDDPLVQVMAAGLGVTPAQLLIAYQLFHNHAVVVKSSTAAHLWDNLQALEITLDQSQISALDALNKNKRTFTFKGMGDTHKNYPFKTAF